MATLEEMKSLGYKPVQSGGEQLAGFLNNVLEAQNKQAEKRQKDEGEKVKMYLMYREAGYSEDAASERVTRQFGAQNFLENMFPKKEETFQKPTGQDKYAKEERKQRVELGEKRASIREKMAKAKAYDKGTLGGGLGRGEGKRDSPNQLQMYLQYLEDLKQDPEASMSIDEIEDQILKTRTRLREALNLQPPEQNGQPSQPRATKPTYAVGQKYRYRGKVVTIKAVNQDGSVVI